MGAPDLQSELSNTWRLDDPGFGLFGLFDPEGLLDEEEGFFLHWWFQWLPWQCLQGDGGGPDLSIFFPFFLLPLGLEERRLAEESMLPLQSDSVSRILECTSEKV